MLSTPEATIRNEFTRIYVIDSHTGGEPTRVVIAGGPDPGNSSLAERRERLRQAHDRFRSAVVNEPRGSQAIVGALLTEPTDPSCSAGVIFFNNVGFLGMCGHGTIGVATTLAHLGRISPGMHRFETPVGIVSVRLNEDGSVSFENVASYRRAANVTLQVPGHGQVTGDIAWGGNWFFLTKDRPCELRMENLEQLTAFAWAMRKALNDGGAAVAEARDVDHIYIYDDVASAEADSRNFVLCPGGSYDRSPCGTGTSARLACKFADGEIKPGQVWRQASILGSLFEGSLTVRDSKVYPTITGRAHITSEAQLLIHERDPFAWGIPG